MNNIANMYLDLQIFINATTLWGWLPLDIVAHFVGGTAITILLLKCRFSFKQVFVSVVLLALSKELMDFFLVGKTQILESLKDIVVTCAYPTMLLGVRRLQKKLSKISNHQT